MVNIHSPAVQLTAIFFGHKSVVTWVPIKGQQMSSQRRQYLWFQPSAEHVRLELVQTAVSTPVTVHFW
jgi:hypothetical protein